MAFYSIDETAAFTGHRASRLPWRYDELDSRCLLLKRQIEMEAFAAYSEGKRNFICGIALGIDAYSAEAVLKLRAFKPDTKLICVFPYPLKSERSNAIAAHADEVIMLCDKYSSGCLHQRNCFFVDNSSLLIAVYDGKPSGGTAETIDMAMKNKIRCRLIQI